MMTEIHMRLDGASVRTRVPEPRVLIVRNVIVAVFPPAKRE